LNSAWQQKSLKRSSPDAFLETAKSGLVGQSVPKSKRNRGDGDDRMPKIKLAKLVAFSQHKNLL
jgi:hypothetical protein